RHTRFSRDWSSDVCSSDLLTALGFALPGSMPGDPAPDFTLTDTYGTAHTLSDYRGQWVVLEWLNYDCPFVRKHYNGQNMQALQEIGRASCRERGEGPVVAV